MVFIVWLVETRKSRPVRLRDTAHDNAPRLTTFLPVLPVTEQGLVLSNRANREPEIATIEVHAVIVVPKVVTLKVEEIRCMGAA